MSRLRSPSRAPSVKREDVPRRGIFYQNPLQPPELPPSSTIALRSLAESHHHQHQSSYNHQQSAVVILPPEPALLPTRPQSSGSRTRQTSGLSSSCRPTAFNSPRANGCGISTKYRSLLGQPGEGTAPEITTTAKTVAASMDLRTSSRAAQLNGPQREKYVALRTPRASLGIMETLMHRPTFSIAQAAIVPMRSRGIVNQQVCNPSGME